MCAQARVHADAHVREGERANLPNLRSDEQDREGWTLRESKRRIGQLKAHSGGCRKAESPGGLGRCRSKGGRERPPIHLRSSALLGGGHERLLVPEQAVPELHAVGQLQGTSGGLDSL